MPRWRNWQTRTLEGRVEQSLEVQILSSAHPFMTEYRTPSGEHPPNLVPNLVELSTPELPPALSVSRFTFPRKLPVHYQDDVLIGKNTNAAFINILQVKDSILVIPADDQSNFKGFMDRLRREKPDLAKQMVSPGGTAKSVANSTDSPIKVLTKTEFDGVHLPGDEELYGWNTLRDSIRDESSDLVLQFQGNNLYFNYGSVFFDGETVYAPQEEWRDSGFDHEQPMIMQTTDGKFKPFIFKYAPDESFSQNSERLKNELIASGAKAAFGASPPFVIPDAHGEPIYLDIAKGLKYPANDVRHYIFCPYLDGPFMFPELSRLQGTDPDLLTKSLSGNVEDRVMIRLDESLQLLGNNMRNIRNFLDRVGYKNRYEIYKTKTGISLLINLLEGVYSHIIPAIRRNGEFEILQTSGTIGNISGRDGLTYNQSAAMIRELNDTDRYKDNPIIMAFSGSQGNDVPNIVVKGADEQIGLLEEIAPKTSLSDVKSKPRGRVTTPRMGLAVKK